MSRQGSKRPLGLLLAWLECSHKHRDRSEHYNARFLLDRATRQPWRDWLHGQPFLEPLLKFEMECCQSDRPITDEPEVIV